MVNNALEAVRNEAADLYEFRWLNPRHTEPDAAYVRVDDEAPYNKIAIDIFPEDRKALEAAGYEIRADPQQMETIPVILDETGRRIGYLITPDGEKVAIQRPDKRRYQPTGTIGAPRQEVDGTAALKPQLELVPRPEQGRAIFYSKIAQVMGAIGAVPERGQHGQGYKYITDGDLFAAVRQEMAKVNLAMLPPRLLGKRTEKDGDYIDIEFTLACGDTGVTETTPWIAKLGNNGDKAIHAAMTMCVKYFLKYTFLISTEDTADADADNSGQQSRQQQAERKPRQQSKPVPKPAPQKPPTTSAGQGTPAAASDDDPRPAEAPENVLARLLNDAAVRKAWKSSWECRDTINVMWREETLNPGMADEQMVAALIARMKSPTHGKSKKTDGLDLSAPPDDAPNEEVRS